MVSSLTCTFCRPAMCRYCSSKVAVAVVKILIRHIVMYRHAYAQYDP